MVGCELTQFNDNNCWRAADLFGNIFTRTWAPNNMREKRSFIAIPRSQDTYEEVARASQEGRAVLAKAEARAMLLAALLAMG